MIYTSPKPHQMEGAKFMVKKKAAILAFKTGKGKTLTSLACVHRHVKNNKEWAVVFAPVKAYDKVWPQEIKKHSDMKIIKLPQVYGVWEKTQSFDFLFEYDIVLVKYTDVQKFGTLNPTFLVKLCNNRVTVYDEAHKLKNPSTILVKLLSFSTSNAKCKWALTATAVGNSLEDLWGLMDFLQPSYFGTKVDFQREYCVMKEKVIGKYPNGKLKKIKSVVGHKNLDKLNEVTSQFMMTVNSDISVKFHEIKYNITDAEETIYLKAAKGVLERDKDDKKGFAQRIPDLQRAVDGSRDLYGELQVDYRGSKYQAYLNWIRELVLGKKQSVIIFSEFLDTHAMLIKLIKEDFKEVPIYEISGAKIEDPHKFPCIVLATSGGSESLNLKFANHIAYYSIPFSVFRFVQTTGRITRMDSEFLEDLNVYMPYCETTVDYYKYKYLKVNAELIHKVLGKEANLPEKVEGDERKEMLGELRKNILFRLKRMDKKKMTSVKEEDNMGKKQVQTKRIRQSIEEEDFNGKDPFEVTITEKELSGHLENNTATVIESETSEDNLRSTEKAIDAMINFQKEEEIDLDKVIHREPIMLKENKEPPENEVKLPSDKKVAVREPTEDEILDYVNKEQKEFKLDSPPATVKQQKYTIYLVMMIIAAVGLASMAAFFSVIGLSKLFSGVAVAVMVMAAFIEFGKIATVAYLDRFWKVIPVKLKWYLLPAVIGAMLLTSASIFGYLSSGYQIVEDKYKTQEKLVDLEIQKKEALEVQLQGQKEQVELKQTRIRQLGEIRKQQEVRLDSLYNRGWSTSAKRTEKIISNADSEIQSLTGEITRITESMNMLRTSISELEMNALELTNTDITAELGPLRFTARLFNRDLNSVVSWFTFMIIFLFDPMAMSLIIAVNHLTVYMKKQQSENRW